MFNNKVNENDNNLFSHPYHHYYHRHYLHHLHYHHPHAESKSYSIIQRYI